MRAIILLVGCGLGGCFYGAGGAVGYGTKRGFYAGVSVTAGISAGGATFEVGGTSHGPMTQIRGEAEANRGKFTGWKITEDHFYPAARAGFGGVYTEGAWSKAYLIGPEVMYPPNKNYCDGNGAPMIYGGVEYRYIAGESQVVFAPHYEVISDICLR